MTTHFIAAHRRKPLRKTLILAATTAIALSASAVTPPKVPAAPMQANPPRAVTTSDTAAPPIIECGLLQSTLFELPEGEKVAKVYGGDTEGWVIDGGKTPSRFISVKPKSISAGATTNLHIISDHDVQYAVQLREVSKDGDPHYDSTVLLSSADAEAKTKQQQPPVFVSVAEVAAKEAQLQKEAADAKASADAAKAADRADKLAAAKSASLINCLKTPCYVWDKKKAQEYGWNDLLIWHDDKFTYISGKFQEQPVFYEMKDKKGSLITYDYAEGQYTITKLVQSGYLTIGKAKLDFHREAN